MNDKNYWFDSMDNITKVYKGVWVICALTILAEAFVHMHPYFEIEEIYGFYAWSGLLASILFVGGAIVIRRVLVRHKGYYDE